MARSDLLVDLVEAASRRDDERFKRTLNALISEERAREHHVLADRLEEAGTNNGAVPPDRQRLSQTSRQAALAEVQAELGLSELVIPAPALRACLEVVEEQNRGDLLRAHNLEPRNRLLLAGPPGNGKTSLAGALARELFAPFFVVRYEALIGSFLGETAGNLRRLFDFVQTRRCLLFFDEFDAIAKERGDTHDTGEIKRVVSSLLLQIDDLPSYVLVVVATNHPELLDRAVWRRFQIRLELPAPTVSQRVKWFQLFQSRTGMSLGLAPRTLAERLGGVSYSELRDFAEGVARRIVLSMGELKPRAAASEELDLWTHRYSLSQRSDGRR